MKEHSFMQDWILTIIIVWGIAFLGIALGAGYEGSFFAFIITAIDLLWHFGYTIRFHKNGKRAKYLGSYIKNKYYESNKRKFKEFIFQEDYNSGYTTIFQDTLDLNITSIVYPANVKRNRPPRHRFEMDSAVEVYTYAKNVLKSIGDDQLKAYVYYGGYIGGNGKPIEVSTYRISQSSNIFNGVDLTVTSNAGGGSGSWYYVIGTEALLKKYFERRHYAFHKIYPRFFVKKR